MCNDKWIKSEEKLPEAHVKVLVYDGYDYIEVRHYVPNKEGLKYGWYPGRHHTYHTYWMPLPELPKKEKNVDE